MSFKIISVGWDCARFIEWTLQSIDEQVCPDWQVMIVDDATPDPEQARVIREWCLKKRQAGDNRWHYRINEHHLGAVRNQVEGIRCLKPEPDDVIVFLDLDGDKLAHPEVLTRLADAYRDETLVTYGSYRPVPDMGTSTMASAFPAEVVQRGSYREWIRTGGASFNHLRTIKGKIFHAIPDDQFRFPETGQWYQYGTDYIFMTAALELAGGNYKFIPEVLLIYNHANPNADYLRGPHISIDSQNYLHRPTLQPLERS